MEPTGVQGPVSLGAAKSGAEPRPRPLPRNRHSPCSVFHAELGSSDVRFTMGLEAGFAQLVRKGSERLAGTAMAYVVPVSQPACASGLGGFGFCPLGGGLGGGGHSPG